MKKLLNSDLLRAVQFKSNTTAKCVKYQCKMHNTSEIANQKSWIWSSVHRCQILECYKNFCKPPNTFKNFPRVSKVFRAFPNTSKDFQKFSKIFKSCWKIALRTFWHFLIFSEDFEDFWRLLTISEDFKKIKMLEGHFRNFPKIFEDVRRFSKIFKNFGYLLVRMFLHSSVLFPQVFQRNSKHSTKETGTLPSCNWPTIKIFHVYVTDK